MKKRNFGFGVTGEMGMDGSWSIFRAANPPEWDAREPVGVLRRKGRWWQAFAGNPPALLYGTTHMDMRAAVKRVIENATEKSALRMT